MFWSVPDRNSKWLLLLIRAVTQTVRSTVNPIEQTLHNRKTFIKLLPLMTEKFRQLIFLKSLVLHVKAKSHNIKVNLSYYNAKFWKQDLEYFGMLKTENGQKSHTQKINDWNKFDHDHHIPIHMSIWTTIAEKRTNGWWVWTAIGQQWQRNFIKARMVL